MKSICSTLINMFPLDNNYMDNLDMFMSLNNEEIVSRQYYNAVLPVF